MSINPGIDATLLGANLREQKKKDAQRKEDDLAQAQNEPQSLREAVMAEKRRASKIAKAPFSFGAKTMQASGDYIVAMKKFSKLMRIVAMVNFLLPFLFFIFVALIGIGIVYTSWWTPLAEWWYGVSSDPLKNADDKNVPNDFSGTHDQSLVNGP